MILFSSAVISSTYKLTESEHTANLNSSSLHTNNNEVDMLFNDLISGSKGTETETFNKSEKFKIENDNSNLYITEIRNVIDKGLNIDAEKGKSCRIEISLDRNGKILASKIKDGSNDLCNNIINQLDNIKLPAPPNDEVYQRIKTNLFLQFKY